jgi:PEP-CTERM motif
MKPAKLLAVAVLVLIPLAALADSNATFTNNDGTWQSNSARNTLTLSGSTLSGVSNLIAPYNCPPPACSGTVSLTTGILSSGSLDPAGACPPGGCTPAIFSGAGSSFNVTSTGAGGGFTFTGNFSSESWMKFGSGVGVFWTFIGQIVNGDLKLGNGMDFNNIDAGEFQITTVGGQPTVITKGPNKGGLQWTDNTGSTNFPSPVPEPSTLALFGGGLIVVGLLGKRRLAGRIPAHSLD